MSGDHDVDHYEVLGVELGVTAKDLTSAYRKLARKLHPDKNKDNPNAAEVFDRLKKSYDFLAADDDKRAAFDRRVRARREQKARDAKLEGKRRSMKESLEAREREHAAAAAGAGNKRPRPGGGFSFGGGGGGGSRNGSAADAAEKRRKMEINRIREAEQARTNRYEEILQAKKKAAVAGAAAAAAEDKEKAAAATAAAEEEGKQKKRTKGTPAAAGVAAGVGSSSAAASGGAAPTKRVKVTWKQSGIDWREESIRRTLEATFGAVESVVARTGVAIVEFATATDAEAALRTKKLKGLKIARLKVKAAPQSGPAPAPAPAPASAATRASGAGGAFAPAAAPAPAPAPVPAVASKPAAQTATAGAVGAQTQQSFASFEGDTIAMMQRLAAMQKAQKTGASS
eukprot:g3260.t1